MDERTKIVKQRQRIRGVRASRVKLNHAMAEAGIKTQAALAERIADLEELESAPKDLVSRVFRGKWVEPASLERVARALNAAAHTLYLSRDETDDLPAIPVIPELVAPASPAPTRGRWIAAGCIGLSLLLTTGLAIYWPSARQICSIKSFLYRPHSAQGRLGVLIGRFENDPDNLGQSYLAAVFRNDERLAPYVSVVTTCRCLVLGSGNEPSAKLRALRARGRELLQSSSAHILLWGLRDGDLLKVHFISSRPDDGTSIALTLDGDVLPIHEASLQIPMKLGWPGPSLADIEAMSLNLMQPQRLSMRKLQRRAIANYRNRSGTHDMNDTGDPAQLAHRP